MSDSPQKISVILGTRPEAIKLAPVILALKAHPEFACHVCVTAQHREMLDQVLEAFDIQPDKDLDLMMPDQSLAGLSARALEGIDAYLKQERPDRVLIQGDTTTVFCAALAAFYNQIPVGHVEAGLRTGNLQSPWPEEANRVLTSRLTALHFAPTEQSRQNLLHEGIPPDRIVVTGNTVIDALFMAKARIERYPPSFDSLPPELQQLLLAKGANAPRMVLITGHRRENFGVGFENICRAIARSAESFPDVHFIYPVHLNPNVREPVERILGEGRRRNIHLIPPQDYLPFVALMDRAHLILTDSGGIQEEAPSLGKPVLVMRDITERPEALAAGTVQLVGTNAQRIIEGVTVLLTRRDVYETMSRAHNPYGDGQAVRRHIEALRKRGTKL